MVESTLDTDTLPDELCHRREVADLVRHALWTLPAETRDLLLEKYWRHRSLADMAVDLGIGEGAVKSRLHRARLALRNALLESGGVSAGFGTVLEVIR